MTSSCLAVGSLGEVLGAVTHPANVGAFLMVLGAAFGLAGALGLVRLPDAYARLQAVSKGAAAGAAAVLLGAAVTLAPACHALHARVCVALGAAATAMPGYADGAAAAKALLAALLVAGTGAVAAHALARGAHRAGVRLWEGSGADEYLGDR